MEAASSNAVRFYPWTIDNKYYSAEVNLCVVPSQLLVTAEIAEAVQAFVLYFDSTQVSFCLLLGLQYIFWFSAVFSETCNVSLLFLCVPAPVEIGS